MKLPAHLRESVARQVNEPLELFSDTQHRLYQCTHYSIDGVVREVLQKARMQDTPLIQTTDRMFWAVRKKKGRI